MPAVLVTILRGQVSITIDAPAHPEEQSAALLDQLQGQLRRCGVEVTRQLSTRLYAYPADRDDVARLAEACRVWLAGHGHQVMVEDR